MKKYFDANPPYIKADEGMVLCDGKHKTGLGGRVSCNDTDILEVYKEMTLEEAEILLGGNKEISDEELGAMVREVL